MEDDTNNLCLKILAVKFFSRPRLCSSSRETIFHFIFRDGKLLRGDKSAVMQPTSFQFQIQTIFIR